MAKIAKGRKAIAEVGRLRKEVARLRAELRKAKQAAEPATPATVHIEPKQ